MSGEKKRSRPVAHDEQTDTARPQPAGEAAVDHRLDPDEAWDQMEEILTTGKDPQRLPVLVGFLDKEQQLELVTTRGEQLRSVATGDVVLEVMRGVDAPVLFVVSFAVRAKAPVTANNLRRYARRLHPRELATITGPAFDDLRSILTGSLRQELPEAFGRSTHLNKNAGFIRWLLDTTPPRVAAHLLAESADAALAATLDAEGLWGWLDHLQGAQGYYPLLEMLPAVQDAAAKTKLTALLGPLAADPDQQMQFHEDHLHDLVEGVDHGRSARELVDLLAAAGMQSSRVPLEKIGAALRRAPASADDVLFALRMTEASLPKGMPILLETPGVTGDQILAYWWAGPGEDRERVLADQSQRRALRKHVGKNLRVLDLLDRTTEGAHRLILRQEAVFRWFAEDATADDLLWFCGTEGGAASVRACRMVRDSARGMKWIHELGPGADRSQLRIVALNGGDAAATRYIREILLGDVVEEEAAITSGKASDAAVYGGGKERLDEALHVGGEHPLARLADLDERERAAIARDHQQTVRLMERLDRDELVRAAYLLDLRVSQVVASLPPHGFHRDIVAYLRTRPAAEEAATVKDDALLARGIQHVHPDPLLTFPSLEQPAVLVDAIARVPSVLERLLKGSDPNLVLRLLAKDPVRASALPVLAANPEFLDGLPRYQDLGKRGQKAFDKLEEAVDRTKGADEASEAMEEIYDGTYQGDDRAEREGRLTHGAEQRSSLGEGLALLAREGGSTTSALALLRSHRDQVPDLLARVDQWPAVAHLRDLVGLPPTTVFPEYTIEQLMQLSNARRWLMEGEHGFLVLGRLAGHDAALAALARSLDGDLPGARDWLQRLPVAAGLTAAEARVLDRLETKITDADVLRQLFRVRYGASAPEQYDEQTMRRLYETMSRLPAGHVQQERIKEIVNIDVGEGFGGYWAGDRQLIAIDDENLPDKAKDTSPEHAHWLTVEQMRAMYGFDETVLETKVAEGLIEKQHFEEGDLYRVKQVEFDQFTSTVLHEVGHAVDDILGGQTELIFGRVGWRQYSEADFDVWASEMGGWDRVEEADRARIREVWSDSLRSARPVAELVGSSHPALAARYADVGVVADARAGKTNHYRDRTAHRGRVFIAQPQYRSWFSLPESSATVAPSDYSLHAPPEYFAECYVEYYRGVDGSPGSQQRKGGALASWIKRWFDEHVDRVRYDPQRVNGGGTSP